MSMPSIPLCRFHAPTHRVACSAGLGPLIHGPLEAQLHDVDEPRALQAVLGCKGHVMGRSAALEASATREEARQIGLS